MPKFPQLLILLALATQARASFSPGGLGHEQTPAAQSTVAASGRETNGLGFRLVAIPEPGVFVAVISGATILLARRRR